MIPPPAVVRLGLNSSRCGKLSKCPPGYPCTCIVCQCTVMHYWRKLERYHCCARLKCAQWNPICRDLNTSQRLQYSIFNSKLPSSKYPRTLNQVGGVGNTEKYAVVSFCAFSSKAPLSLLKAESFVKSPCYRIKVSSKGGKILES